jgi:hypothetical protein
MQPLRRACVPFDNFHYRWIWARVPVDVFHQVPFSFGFLSLLTLPMPKPYRRRRTLSSYYWFDIPVLLLTPRCQSLITVDVALITDVGLIISIFPSSCVLHSPFYHHNR